MKKLFFLFFFFYSTIYFSQNLYTKDKVNLGDKSVFLNSCMDGFDKETIDLNGINVNKYQYCSCVCDNLIPQILSTELIEAVKNDDVVSLFLKDNNFNLIYKCVEEHMNIEDDYVYSNNKLNEYSKEFGVKTCVNEVLRLPDQDHNWTDSDAEKYCSCAINSLYSKGYTFKDLQQASDESSIAFNEIVMPCVELVFKKLAPSSSQFENKYTPDDISGSVYSSKILLIDYNNGLKIKIEIEGVVKYFLFDTGASDLIIDRSFERELLINGAIDKSNYIGKRSYVLANNEEIIADIIKVNNLKIGDFILNNVVIAVVEEGGMLCGKSLLDKFRNWEFNKLNNSLILFK